METLLTHAPTIGRIVNYWDYESSLTPQVVPHAAIITKVQDGTKLNLQVFFQDGVIERRTGVTETPPESTTSDKRSRWSWPERT